MKIIYFLVAVCLAALSCTKEKTDYEAAIDSGATEFTEFKEVVNVLDGDYNISIEALNGAFYNGYNEIRLKITNSHTGEIASVSAVTFLPINTNADGVSSSCPHRYDLLSIPDSNYYSGYSVFTSKSSADETWELYIGFTIANQPHALKYPITVQEQKNKNLNMTAFTGKDDEQYVIALIAPHRPKVAENELVAGIYRFNKPTSPPAGDFPDPAQFTYTEVGGYTLMLDPRMPEPSMGNHSSPNNRDLTQESDGLYHGVVNYTMTGNWTLNLMMLNQNGRILKGTEVPTDFTPGIEGAKSELYIDVLF
ncbi:MAG TPA: hypothetical protein VNQ55_01770 [Parapedobacter sp.]|nr:hypothetical protein [Parapedobacter sp.]